MSSPQYNINFIGDVMLGRLIDQAFPTHVDEPSEAKIVKSFLKSRPNLKDYGVKSPWGTALPLFQAADLNVINLETSATTNPKKWPDKVFNYRMHPHNIAALTAANVHYASLANNHTLDFCEEGMRDTIKALQGAGIAFAGVGTTPDEAVRPAILKLARKTGVSFDNVETKNHQVHIWSAADHPQEWGAVPGFNLITYGRKTRDQLRSAIVNQQAEGHQAVPLKVFSVHWGPNYSWQPAKEIQSLAHFLVDECGIDIIHGHSSHHVQGVEIYKGRLIIYGCGDFVDDYALTAEYRNDLSAVWRVGLTEKDGKLDVDKLEIFPSKITSFQAHLLNRKDPDHTWVVDKITRLSKTFGTRVQDELGTEGQLIVKLKDAS